MQELVPNFNRTKVECKFRYALEDDMRGSGFNRTKVECKFPY